jgi:tripartite-type tricarboxylate transporter receptor subunit TctC
VTRIIVNKLAEKWSRPVLVENRPGFVQNIGAEAVAKAGPDGYTLLSTAPAPLVTNQFLQSNLNYDARAFVPVTVMVKFPFILLTHASSPYKTLDELVAFAKANPGKLNLASAGVGSPPHLAGECRRQDPALNSLTFPTKVSNRRSKTSWESKSM